MLREGRHHTRIPLARDMSAWPRMLWPAQLLQLFPDDFSRSGQKLRKIYGQPSLAATVSFIGLRLVATFRRFRHLIRCYSIVDADEIFGYAEVGTSRFDFPHVHFVGFSAIRSYCLRLTLARLPSLLHDDIIMNARLAQWFYYPPTSAPAAPQVATRMRRLLRAAAIGQLEACRHDAAICSCQRPNCRSGAITGRLCRPFPPPRVASPTPLTHRPVSLERNTAQPPALDASSSAANSRRYGLPPLISRPAAMPSESAIARLNASSVSCYDHRLASP